MHNSLKAIGLEVHSAVRGPMQLINPSEHQKYVRVGSRRLKRVKYNVGKRALQSTSGILFNNKCTNGLIIKNRRYTQYTSLREYIIIYIYIYIYIYLNHNFKGTEDVVPKLSTDSTYHRR